MILDDMLPQFSKSCIGSQKSTTFWQTRIRLHLNAISKNANGARAFMGNFLCGLERVKRFVKVHLHYMLRNLKKDKRNVDVAPPGKVSADAHAYINKNLRQRSGNTFWRDPKYSSKFSQRKQFLSMKFCGKYFIVKHQF